MEDALKNLNSQLEVTLKALTGPLGHERKQKLHDHEVHKLPDPVLSQLAASSVDLLHAIEQLLTPASLILADHFLGYVDSKCLSAAVEFKVPDYLDNGPKTITELAQGCGAREDRLLQVMRTLHNKGIFAYDHSTSTYSNNLASTLLTSEHWTQWHNWVELYGDVFYDIARGIPASLKADASRTAAQINFNTDDNMFDYFTAQGWLPRLHRTLGGGAIAQSPGILQDYPWTEFGSSPFLDVGGGEGALVALLLREYKSMEGGLLDTAKVVEHAKKQFHQKDGKFHDVADRVALDNLIVGDFLESVPSFEFYTMKWCLHDWKDDQAVRILQNIRNAIKVTEKSRLVVMESILKEGRMGRLSRYGDLTMAISANGLERTQAEWECLAKRSGWQIARVYVLRGAWPCAMEFRPIDIMAA